MDRNTTQPMHQKEAAPVSSGRRTVGDITMEEWAKIADPNAELVDGLDEMEEIERKLGRNMTMAERIAYAFHGKLPSSISTETALDAAGGEAPQEEALKRIVTEYPEFTTDAMQMIKDGQDLTELLSVLDSY